MQQRALVGGFAISILDVAPETGKDRSVALRLADGLLRARVLVDALVYLEQESIGAASAAPTYPSGSAAYAPAPAYRKAVQRGPVPSVQSSQRSTPAPIGITASVAEEVLTQKRMP